MTIPRYAIVGAPELAPPSFPVQDFGPRMKWQLIDRPTGLPIAEFYDRLGSSVDLELNTGTRAQLNVSVWDQYSKEIIALQTCLRCYYGDRLIYNGPVVIPDFDFDAGTVEIHSNNSYYLEHAFFDAQTVYTDQDHGTILSQLVDLIAAPSSVELSLGVLPLGIRVDYPVTSGVTRTQTYEVGQQVWSAITELTGIHNAPDFSIEPFAADGSGDYGLFQVHTPKQGDDKRLSAIFHYGWGENNCLGFKWGPSAETVRNEQTVLGQADGDSIAPKGYFKDINSQKIRGKIEHYESSFPSKYQSIVDDRARELVEVYNHPPDFFTVQPAIEGVDEGYGVPPQVFEDYGLGDEITVIAKKGNFVVPVEGRVTAIRLEEATTAGDVRVTLVCWPNVPVSG